MRAPVPKGKRRISNKFAGTDTARGMRVGESSLPVPVWSLGLRPECVPSGLAALSVLCRLMMLLMLLLWERLLKCRVTHVWAKTRLQMENTVVWSGPE